MFIVEVFDIEKITNNKIMCKITYTYFEMDVNGNEGAKNIVNSTRDD